MRVSIIVIYNQFSNKIITNKCYLSIVYTLYFITRLKYLLENNLSLFISICGQYGEVANSGWAILLILLLDYKKVTEKHLDSPIKQQY